MRKRRPSWGPKKLEASLEAAQGGRFPAASTIGDILTRRGLVTPRKRRIRVPPQGVATSSYSGPNAAWCIDHKGHFTLTDGNRCGPLTLMDGFARYLFRCEAVEAGGGTTIGRLERFHRTLNERTIEGGPLRSPEYPDSRLVRRVNHRGIVSFQNTDVRVGRSVIGEPVYFHVVDEDRWDVYYGRHYLLTVERRRGELRTTQRPPAQGDAERRPPSVSFGA